MKTWTQADLSAAIGIALDAFVWEQFNAPSFDKLAHAENLKILRALKADAAWRFAVEWTAMAPRPKGGR